MRNSLTMNAKLTNVACLSFIREGSVCLSVCPSYCRSACLFHPHLGMYECEISSFRLSKPSFHGNRIYIGKMGSGHNYSYRPHVKYSK